MKKRVIVICCILVILSIVFALVLNGRSKDTNHYEKTKKEAVRFLEKNEDELKIAFDDLMLKEVNSSDEYKGKSYMYYKTNSKEYVQLGVDQGRLGAQYWGIIYCPNNNLIDDGSDISIYDESKNYDPSKDAFIGNNISIKEKLKDGWYFYYDDYDGKINVSELLEK